MESTAQRLALLEREVAALRAQVGRRRRLGRARAVALGLVLVALLALSPLAALAANFTDLNPGSPHNANINAIADAGISLGCNPAGTQYCPNQLVTREQMASFLARTAGLGTNPPIANAQTAVTAQTATNATNAQNAVNATNATNATNAANAVIAQTALDAPNAQPKYVRTVVVSPVGTDIANGTALRNALNGIAAPSATNRFLVKIEPGEYDLGAAALTLPDFVDIEGSGLGNTIVKRAAATVLNTGDNTELRQFTIRCTASSCTALTVPGKIVRLVDMLVVTNAGGSLVRGLSVNGASSVTVVGSTIRASGAGTSHGIAFEDPGSTTLFLAQSFVTSIASTVSLGITIPAGSTANLTVRQSTIFASGSTARGFVSSGNSTTTIEHSQITGATTTISISASNNVSVANTQLHGGNTINGGFLMCAGVYDEFFNFSASTCP